MGVLRLFVGFALLMGAVALLGWKYREPLERFGHWFVDRLGTPGIAAGAFLADGWHFPLPPQFYLFAGIAGGVSTTAALASATVGSILGGLNAFALFRRAGHIRFFDHHIKTTRVVVEGLVSRWGGWGLAAAGMLPVSYFALCALAGMMRLRWRDFVVNAVMRIPRLALSYLLIAAAWG